MRDPRDEKDDGSGIYCDFCKVRWARHHLKRTPEDNWICPNCRLTCDYCEQAFPSSEVLRVLDGKACSDCICDHDLMPLDKVELYDTLTAILRL